MKTVLLLFLTGSVLIPILAASGESPAASNSVSVDHGAGKTAAEQDWVFGNPDLNPLIPWYCEGFYSAPEAFRNKPDYTDDSITATARNALLVENQSTILDGNVEVTGQGRLIKAAHLILFEGTDDVGTQTTTAEGPISIREHGLFIKADQARGNLNSSTGVLDNATFLMHQSKLRGSADHLVKTGDSTLEIDNGTITRCDPGNNFWRLRGDNIKLYPDDGYGLASNVSVRIRNIPIAFFPYLRFPLNDQRNSGLLMPSIGYGPDGGLDTSIPWYFNLAENYDATWSLRNLSKRGFVHDTEMRYMNRFSTNFLNVVYLNKDKIYDDRDILDLSTGRGYADQKKTDRWLLYFDHAGAWGRWNSRISYSVVSDIDYLNDIDSDIAAATRSSGRFQFSGSTGTPALRRTGTLSYRGDNWDANLLTRSYQSLLQNVAKQYSALPQITYRKWQKLAFIDFQFLGQYTNFDKDNEDITGALRTVGKRWVVDSKLSTSLSNSWGYLTPSLGIIHRKYELRDTPVNARIAPAITTPFASIDSGLILERFFTRKTSELQQTLEPRLYFLYVKPADQSDLPQFDTAELTPRYSRMFRVNRFSGYDRVGDASQLSMGLSSAVFNAGTGEEYFKASFGQIFYFKDREVVFNSEQFFDPGTAVGIDPLVDPGGAEDDGALYDTDNTAGSSPLFAETRVKLGGGLSLYGLFEWEPHESRTNRSGFSLKYYGPKDRKILNLTYTYTNPDVKQPRRAPRNSTETDVSFIWPLQRKWSILGRWNFGWDNNQTIESLFGVEYNDCCWKARIAYRRFLEEPRRISLVIDDPSAPGDTTVVSIVEPRTDSGVFLEFQLKGLSSLGRRLDLLLADSIPGYRRREESIGF